MQRGVERNYILYVPSTYSAGEATPLVLNLHGKFGNADQQMTTSAMNAVAEEEGFLVAYPNSVGVHWDLDTDVDVRFIDTLLGTLGSQYTVDASRVYSTGFSAAHRSRSRAERPHPDRDAVRICWVLHGRRPLQKKVADHTLTNNDAHCH